IRRGLRPRTPGVFRPRGNALLRGLACGVVLAAPAGASDLSLTTAGESLSVEVSEAETIFMHGLPSLQFTLTDRAADAMAALTGRMIGEEMAVSLCGYELVRATVRERISGRGIVNLPSAEAAIAVTGVLKGEADCETLAPHFPD
ncbi:MAG: hypothetical protein HKO14_05720, partial [Silicimonas sp.]|nr:hypothetical protein [Silicimonas sp.]